MIHQQNKNYTLNCKGKLVSLEKPIVMGILNLTNNSFYDGNQYNTIDKALIQAEKMINDGVTIIDIGGMSTKPNALEITDEEEIQRILPIIEKIHQQFPSIILSVDTYRSKVANLAIDAGVSIINDISGGQFDDTIFDVAAKNNCPYIMMHIQGTPKTMQQNPTYNNVVVDVMDYFVQQIQKAKSKNVKDIIIDVGFGFGKTIEHNYQLLKNMAAFQLFEYPILAGISRKSMIYKPLSTTANDALNGTTALNMLALQNGANILRVHDVKEAIETIQLFELYNKN